MIDIFQLHRVFANRKGAHVEGLFHIFLGQIME
ncbi:Uncharacterised protein [Vibrio cholerae]|nr:Uncharacterised protein [Vibrio cholerae]